MRDRDKFSPEGHWVAYTSNESGRYEVYVIGILGASGKYQISNNGGTQPRWRRDGREMYYRSLDGKLMAVPVKASTASFDRQNPEALFETHGAQNPNFNFNYDVTADGQRFLLVHTEAETVRPVTLLTNWQAGLK